MPEQLRIPKIPAPKPKKKKGRKLVFFLFIFFVAVLIVLFFRSSFSRITQIEVAGNKLVTSEQIEQTSEVLIGDQFFGVSTADVMDKVNHMKMILSSEVTKSFPGKLKIVVHEQPKVAFEVSEDGRQQYVLADGSTYPVQGLSVMIDKPILSGWSASDPNKAALAKTMATISQDLFDEISEIRPFPSESYSDRIKLYTRSGFEVITTIEYLPDKILYLSAYIENLKENDINNGVLTLLEVDSHQALNADPEGDDTAAKDEPKG
ncbi:cell division protein FtsQ/DivIB [Paenibacillus albiflavus]|uniref:cell division protein FtsQ/DivIB n=1 Tax=Paenibacillus albiflavus TaxID=2545760 RepID=UPI0014048AB1|nr:FtsQ-type POTRA domain-containing protein [Paenibacillus albiflavus]